ncbi:glutamate N-acetyltransferase/amino-acid N-acetyltransferase [Virgibacillus natechei]|uniref:Arginine biosynthesis bifunctional protein ArgJ n=1 Tax=Virgibacillus natechei TaxID=1216297 RepID=A0ABS4IGR1_9BACI|nr:bifunctional glutamate N-acetyltransferase/amino-acid acetyltransferase ArgJ [Virgibacillus natechei]MBP1970128.1 glutamate N-acetyltransferase/amino-acid N-acetyltransferase [Virgibacillus natechei]UZD14202.1 bifunctional glutamate N-acetyltransferase/amino-acid acetyltransferase ArgJ [Virgibacillus natechei]
MVAVTDKEIHIIKNGNVTSPHGFSAGGLHTGIRKTKLDFGWIHSDNPATVAGVYTLNTFQAAPLKVTKESIEKDNKIQTVVVNSGVANSCTGKQGMSDALEMQKLTADKMNVSTDHVAVASTGLIGVPLPMDNIRTGIEAMTNREHYSPANFATAILTTDTVTKHMAVQIEIDGETITIGGAAKGSGMIDPNMATMLSFITTDAVIDHESLQKALKHTTNQTFNMITVDGDSSTNDMVLVMANGQQNNSVLNESHPQWNDFLQAFQYVCEGLSKQIARDGEGATKLIEVNVTGAASNETASQVAKAVISSSLVKTAIYGSDPNWGRIITAVGYSEQPVDPDKVSVSLGEIAVVESGLPVDFDENEGKQYLENETVKLNVDLQDGPYEATAWGCDLTYDYVKINASYRT